MLNMRNLFKRKNFSECLELIESNKYSWVAKRLSGNDTGLTGGHQAGVYLSREFFEMAISEVNTTEKHNPRTDVECFFPANGSDEITLQAIYYNSKFFPELGLKKKYNEFRLTGWGGRQSPVQNEENTGCVLILAVAHLEGRYQAIALVAENAREEQLVTEFLGEEVEPGRLILSSRPAIASKDIFKRPSDWSNRFPSGKEIFNYVRNLVPRESWNKSIDELLLKRRELEFKVYSEVERGHVLPRIESGFEDVDSFMKIALSVANRRKSRTGSSLEYNLAAVFDDCEVSYVAQAITENRKKPDFLFPSDTAYRNQEFDGERLTMLAAKTCCKDRWRQVLNEANRIEQKHLFTLQEGVSSNQLSEMESANLQLVVPEPNLGAFPREWRPKILNLGNFVGMVKSRQTV